jgi:predicted ATPase
MIFLREIVNNHAPDEGTDEAYPYNIPFIRNMTRVEFKKEVTFIIGENGSGKSTLIEAIAVRLGINPEGGSKNFNFETFATHSDLFRDLTIVRGPRESDAFFLRAESFYNVATEIDRMSEYDNRANLSYGGRSLHSVSHGESFLNTVFNRLGNHGLYILDEPEAALSPTSIFKLMVRMKELVEHNAQFIIVTHSPLLLAFPGADILTVHDDGIHRVEYEESEPYMITKYFLNNHERFLENLFR